MKNSKYIVIAFLVFLIALYELFKSEYPFFSYRTIQPREDYTYIEINGEMVVFPTILEVKLFHPYVAGTRLPSYNIRCGNNNVIKIKNQKMYFILDLKTGKNADYSSKDDFYADLIDKVGRVSKNTFDYTKFDKVWLYYSNFYNNYPNYKMCK